MYCIKCGQLNEDGAKFCVKCGNPFAGDMADGNKADGNINQSNKKKSNIKKIGIVVGSILVILLGIGIFAGGIGDSKYVEAVKKGEFVNYPGKSIENSFKAFFSNPKWKHIVTEDNKNFVEFTGGCTYLDKPVDALVQFRVDKNGQFEITYFSMNDISQNVLMISSLVNKVMDDGVNKVKDPKVMDDGVNKVPDYIMSEENATQIVNDYLTVNDKYVPGVIEISSEDDIEYTIHAYDDMETHRATVGWYTVNKKTGEIKSMF